MGDLLFMPVEPFWRDIEPLGDLAHGEVVPILRGRNRMDGRANHDLVPGQHLHSFQSANQGRAVGVIGVTDKDFETGEKIVRRHALIPSCVSLRACGIIPSAPTSLGAVSRDDTPPRRADTSPQSGSRAVASLVETPH